MMKKFTKSDKQLGVLCLIPTILVFVFSYIPLFGLVLAFKRYNYSKGIFGSDWVGFENFKFFFTSDAFVRVTRNTLCLNILFIAVGVISAIALAIILFEITSSLKTKIFQTILITPYFMSMVIVAYMVFAILSPENGFLNRALGLNIDWYSKPGAWPVILTIVSVWKGVGMDSIMYYATLMGIDNSLFEAAEIDGASWWQKTRNIVIPPLKSVAIILTILKIGSIFRADFGLFYQVTRNVGVLYPTTDVVDTYVYRALRELNDVGMSTAVGFLQSCVGLIMVMITNTVVKKIDPDSALF